MTKKSRGGKRADEEVIGVSHKRPVMVRVERTEPAHREASVGQFDYLDR